MKRVFNLFIALLFIVFICSGCIDSNLPQNTVPQMYEMEKNIKKEVWNQLSNQEKQHIIGAWENATMTKTVLHKYNSHQTNKHYEGETVYLVHFPSDKAEKFNVYVDVDTSKIIGYDK
ncbi:hypothetical protein A6279_21970 [Bacillus wiedmannii]|uniref:Lipoprotein n=1 Tax=Bacillus wiedmannii TaxID=1890302 RepID=A0AB73R8V6_9BACI|nr:hypothetical protein [Bacillus wiedmannii]MED2836415.1 hypothetical protein [Bacillus wiedmannii]OAK06515.1 hypothetical protein A6278_07080 [Bacillus wiedmannii]OAK13465.1 hypothetical protein A6279_21970 [Bacillus wiedmannii]PEK19770.1 hypothetical protein CN694_25885 [Bacillus wiedmannii]QWI19193.1 hypothetical protein EXW48_25840 [Bacillus wiedmannii]